MDVALKEQVDCRLRRRRTSRTRFAGQSGSGKSLHKPEA